MRCGIVVLGDVCVFGFGGSKLLAVRLAVDLGR